jgi:hypothetical protein
VGLCVTRAEGRDSATGDPIIVDSFTWAEVGLVYDRFRDIEDRNLDSSGDAGDRADAYLRGAEMAAVGGSVLVAVNCGQQLYDVIDITDERSGLSSAKRRVAGISLRYRPDRGEYLQRLLLAAA